ncbi:bifunctional 23S rRNA (guanine(2069)-N(7))-methyltransferase RlmK/23S rRNA (guanine(2445)-N(2))-methyltransferase RlmL [Oceanicoccus sagamiensis]|uniref:Ribosomal RNA large subunit methyltransferase K/L n=1 Tax=Oceanicoccus sagamiensis TaxID=716816 RepID=A0A1X9NG61_9GAMM|nr:bifunctional 23S rRNA (guanine(2069)-N(7))-methyltransferase RlmK/23S rRNA (guanine(2445)-N(2))-methyltransferase RlmL [Oceanicoccus sagamiensis]ARN76161.1 23S rRNA (guanine(2445)-N(2))/(guanine(2069)-N(7))-methyltransferase [Oceanicoccus sagamiensis]
MSQPLSYFATCPKGLESLLLEEIRSMGATKVKETVAGVHFEGPLTVAYRACLWSRLANRVLMPVSTADCYNADELYAAVKAIDWGQHLAVDGTFAIDFSGKLRDINHSHFGALKAKDAIADDFMQKHERRPNVDTDKPDVRVNVRVAKGKVVISIDLSGESLHRRGYRLSGGSAPLKENLAAAILLRADWPGIAAQGGALLDPMCGSGTLLIEGALMMANIAPGLFRQHWGFDGWLGHDANGWLQLVDEAEAMELQAKNRQWPEIRGYDASPKALESAQENIDRAGLNGKVRVLRKELSKFVKPTHSDIARGLVVTNPPYGERLGDESSLIHLYRHLGQRLKSEFAGWKASVFTGNPDLGKQMGIRSIKQYQMFNGAIPSKLLNFDISEASFVHDSSRQVGAPIARKTLDDLGDGARMFANRLRKNKKNLSKWLKNKEISCYRLYDADMPEYAVAVDYYEGWVHVAEYAAPAKVDPAAAEQRLNDVIAAIPVALEVDSKYVVLKQRNRQKGSSQYRKQEESGELFEVKEGQAKLLVNLKDYLDTGLFLDHRPVRLKIAELAKGNRFLNLFSYTSTASVHAALGGATFTDSVDLSSTYLEWSKKNMALNGLSETQHRMIRADVLEWLKTCDNQYDLILLDPPTFSNSKKMEATLDIQRDHVGIIQDAMKLLSADGVLIFSNNQRKFSLDSEALAEFTIENKTDWSLDKDFQRSKKIHQCWFIRHGA